MILFRRSTGYQENKCLIGYANSWTKEMKTSGSMFFYDGEIDNLVDVSLLEKDIEIFYYPHNSVSLLVFPFEESKLRAFIESLSEKTADKRTSFTIDYKTMKEIVFSDFKNYSHLKDENCCFIFNTEDKSRVFPNIFVKTKSFSSSEESVAFPVQVHCSHYVSTPVGHSTDFGKEFVFKLTNSVFHGNYESKLPRGSFEYPTNPKLNQVPENLKTDSLFRLVDSIPFLHKKDSKSELFLDEPETKSLYNRITRDILDKNQVNFSDVLEFGVKETIDLITDKTRMVRILVDIAGGFKKACLLEGLIYGIPLHSDFDWNSYTGELDDVFVCCSEENFPHI
jgi:hypothetical protein